MCLAYLGTWKGDDGDQYAQKMRYILIRRRNFCLH